jgi:hypothetical protein
MWAEVVALVKTRYETLLATHNDIDVRLALQKRLRHWHSLLLRPTGGVYFVPKDFAEEAEAYARFLRSIGSEMWALSVSQDAAPMVHEKFEEHKVEAAKELADLRAQAAAVPVDDVKAKKSIDDEIADEMARMAEMEKRYGLF